MGTRAFMQIGQRFQHRGRPTRHRRRAPHNVEIDEALHAGPRNGNEHVLILADVSNESNLARHVNLIDDRSGSIDGLTAASGLDSEGDRDVLNRRRYRCRRARVHFGVVEKQHADGERDDERADEQTEIQM